MLRIALQICLFLALAVPGFAEDWVATRLRGTAEQMVGGQWVPLERGATVFDGQSVRTGGDGRVDLTRGAEVIQLSAGTQIEVHEGAGKITSIEMSSGMITAEVERRNVQHFSVQTPYLAAIVKGTIFRVSVGGGSAQVEVDRGTVQVQDLLNDLVVDIVRGQEAQVSRTEPLEVSGPGTVAVYTFEGERVVNGTAHIAADDSGRPAQGNGIANSQSSGNSANGNGGGNGNSDGNGNSGNGAAGANDNGNPGDGGGNGNGNSGNSNGGGNGNGNSGNGGGNGNAGNSNGGENGNSGNGHSGGNQGHGGGNGKND
jgi:hypothetical protein